MEYLNLIYYGLGNAIFEVARPKPILLHLAFGTVVPLPLCHLLSHPFCCYHGPSVAETELIRTEETVKDE